MPSFIDISDLAAHLICRPRWIARVEFNPCAIWVERPSARSKWERFLAIDADMLALEIALIYGARVSVVATQISDVSIYVTVVFGAVKHTDPVEGIAKVTCAFLLVVAVFVGLAFRAAAANNSQRTERQ